jgi:hypothetical protein
LLAVIKCIYLPPTYLHFIQDIEDWCLLLMSSVSFVDLPFQKNRMMENHHMDKNPYISSLCPKLGVVINNMTRWDDVAQSPGPVEPKWGRSAPPRWPVSPGLVSKSISNTCQLKSVGRVSNVGKAVLPQCLAAQPS